MMRFARRWAWASSVALLMLGVSADGDGARGEEDPTKALLAAAGQENANLQAGLAHNDSSAVVEALQEMYPTPAASTVAGLDLMSCDGACTIEQPPDQVAAGAAAWLEGQEWRSFVSPIGRPYKREVKDVHIAYVTARGGTGARGALLISPGLTEPVRMQAEFMWDMMNKGYSPIYCLTHRGQGESDRLVVDADPKYNPYYVEYAEDMVEDLRTFVSLVTTELAGHSDDQGKPVYLFCHSMGCAVSLAYLIEEYEAQRANQFSAVVALAPLVQQVSHGMPYSLYVALAKWLVRIGQGMSHLVAQTFEEAYSLRTCDLLAEFDSTFSFTRCKAVTDLCQPYEAQEVGEDKHLGLCVHGLTNRCSAELNDFFAQWFLPFGQVKGKKLAPPILMQMAVSKTGNDGYVENSKATTLCEESALSCTITEYKETFVHSMHYQAKDSLRSTVLGEIDTFLAGHPGSPVAQSALPDGVKGDGEKCGSDLECATRSCSDTMGFFGTCQAKEGVAFVSGVAPLAGASAWLLLLLLRLV